MSGYLDRSDPDNPPMNRDRWIGLVLATLAASMLFFLALSAGKAAVPLLALLDNSLARSGLILCLLGSTFLFPVDSAADDPAIPQRAPNRRRIIAFSLYALGVAVIAAGALSSR